MLLLSGSAEIDFRQKLDLFEGRFPYLYLDGEHNPTVGVGCLVPSAQASSALAWSGPAGIDPKDEWEIIFAAEAGHSAAYYGPMTRLRLPDREIDCLLDSRILEMEKGLIGAIGGVAQMPVAARQSLCDMAYNMGPSRLKQQFFCTTCRFGPAIYRGDWQTAARESARTRIQPARNQYVANLLASLVPPQNNKQLFFA